MLDKVRVDPSDLLNGGALACSLGRGPPSILDVERSPDTSDIATSSCPAA